MAISSTSPFILTSPPDAADTLPSARVLATIPDSGLTLQDSGSEMSIATQGNLATLAVTTAPGFQVYDASTHNMRSTTFSSGDGMSITQPAGQGGTTTFAVLPDSTTQNIEVLVDGVLKSTKSKLNFLNAGSTSFSVVQGSTSSDVTLVVDTTPATDDAKYILQQADAGLPNAQSIGALPTGGLLKFATTTGVLSRAVPATTSAANDYQPGSTILTSIAGTTPIVGTLLVGNSAGTGYDDIIPGTSGYIWTSAGPGSQPSWQIAPGGGTGVVVSGTTQTLSDNITYITHSSSLITFTLPTIANSHPGKYYAIEGYGHGGWTIAQRAGQTMVVGTVGTTAGAGGSISSVLPTDSIVIWCVVSDGVSAAEFVARPTSGQVSVV